MWANMIGDGVTDNADAWDRLIAVSRNIIVPRGSFALSRAPRLTNAESVSIVSGTGSYQGGWHSTNIVTKAEFLYIGPATNIFFDFQPGLDSGSGIQMLRLGNLVENVSFNANGLADTCVRIGYLGRGRFVGCRFNGATGVNWLMNASQFCTFIDCSTSRNEDQSYTVVPRYGMSLTNFCPVNVFIDCQWEKSSEIGVLYGPNAKNNVVIGGAIEANQGDGLVLESTATGNSFSGTWFEANGGTNSIWVKSGAIQNTFDALRMYEDNTNGAIRIAGSYNIFQNFGAHHIWIEPSGTRNKWFNMLYVATNGLIDQTFGGQMFVDMINAAATIRTNTFSSPFVQYGEPFVLWSGTNLYERARLSYDGVYFGDGSNPARVGWTRFGSGISTTNTIISFPQGANDTVYTAYVPGDAQPRLRIYPDQLQIGPGGTNVPDTFWKRHTTNTWITEAEVWSFQQATNEIAFATVLPGNFQLPFTIRGDGMLEFGNGVTNRDASIERTGVGQITIRSNLVTTGITINGEQVTDWTGTGITIVGGALTAATYGSFWPDLTNALIAGTNVTFAYDTGLNKITISSSGGGGGSTNGSSVSVDGTYLAALNVTNSTKIDPSVSGTNLSFNVVPNSLQTNDIDTTFRTFITSQAGTNSGTPLSVDGTLLSQANLADGSKIAVTASGTNVIYDIVGFSLTTNDITAAFFNWIDSQGGGTGGDVWAASNNVFTMTNTFLGPLIANVLQVTNIILINPIGVTAVGTNVADAQDELQLTPGTYTMAWDQDLQQLAKIDWTNGVMAWHNSTNITNITSTALGRSMLAMSSTNNGRDILQVGGLNQAAYSAAWATVTNMTPTLKDVYTKIESLPGGSNNISSWNSNYFSVTGGYLDWIGGSTGGGSGGVDWIGAYGVGTLTNGHISTNIVLADFAITTNKVPTVDGRYLEGSAELALTNTTGSSVSFNFIAQINGTTVLRAARALASAATLDLHGIKAKLVRESSTVASFYALGERQGATVPTVGQGSFGSSGGDTLLLATNIAFNWGQSNTLTWLINIDQTSGAVNLTNTGVQRYSAALYNPGSGGSGSSGGVSNFTVNGVSFLGPIITNTATVTIATNANGHLEFTAVGGGSGAGTNFVLNGILKQPAIITNNVADAGRVVWYTNASGHILAYATNLPSSGGLTNSAMVVGSAVWRANPNAGAGNEVSNLVVRGIVSSVAWNLNTGIPADYDEYNVTFTQNLGTNYSVAVIAEGQAAAIYPYCGIKSGTIATGGFTLWRFKDSDHASLPDGENIRVTVFSDALSSTNLIVSTISASNVVLNGSDLAGLLAAKQPASAVLTNVSALTSGTSTNFLAGDGTFKQVTTNMIPGLNAALAAAGGTPSTRFLFSAFAKDFVSGTNAAAQALDYVSGNGRRMAAFSPSTDNERLFEGVIPPNANLAGGLKITLHFSSTNTGGSNVVWQLQLAPGTSVDPTSTSWNTSVKMTNTFPGSIAITNGSLNYADLAGITNRQPIIGRILRDQGSASDTETGNAFVRAVVLEILDSN